MKIKSIAIFLILIFSINSIWGMGLGDWEEYTKNETYFNSPGGGTIITLVNGKEYKYPDTWYFYKDHIIGIGKNYIEGKYDYEFFIINEKERWKELINTNDLNPKYWERWFRDNWNHIELIKLLAILWFPISIPIILINISFYKKLAKFDKSWKKWATLAAITPAIILLFNILGKFPESF